MIDPDADDMIYGNDDWDDPNMYLPNEFITCFDPADLPLYQKAIAEYALSEPCHGLEIDLSGKWNNWRAPALICWNRGNLQAFWKVFERLRKEMS